MRFLSTLSLRRATRQIDAVRFAGLYFYPRSPCGERPADRCGAFCRSLFLSTLSLRRATALAWASVTLCGFLSTLSLRRATAVPVMGAPHRPQFLSTLSLRRATQQAQGVRLKFSISIHALLAESDGGQHDRKRGYTIFLSTLSLRRATTIHGCAILPTRHFYPRSPCGERQYLVRGQRPNWRISIHALLAESDNAHGNTSFIQVKFLSTLSLRRATRPALANSQT